MRTLWFVGGAALGSYVTYKVLKSPAGHLLGEQSEDQKKLMDAAATHIRQIRRYAFAASQDISPVVGLTHASYALVLLDTLEEVAGKSGVEKTGVDPTRLREFITRLQDMHAEKLQKCDSHLQKILAIEKAESKQIPGFVVAGVDIGAAPRGA